jgi:hypothetical protein
MDVVCAWPIELPWDDDVERARPVGVGGRGMSGSEDCIQSIAKFRNGGGRSYQWDGRVEQGPVGTLVFEFGGTLTNSKRLVTSRVFGCGSRVESMASGSGMRSR